VLALSGAEFASVAARIQLSGVAAVVAPGAHTFTLQYSSTGGSSVSFESAYLEVDPI
jgi:hypothetical protein